MKVYVVEYSSGVYSDHYQAIERIFSTEAAARAYVDKTIAELEYDEFDDGKWADWNKNSRMRNNYDNDMYEVIEWTVSE